MSALAGSGGLRMRVVPASVAVIPGGSRDWTARWAGYREFGRNMASQPVLDSEAVHYRVMKKPAVKHTPNTPDTYQF